MSPVCRICLNGNSKLYDVKNKLLLILYENLTKSKFNSEDARTRALCSFCYQKLQRCHTFSEMALRSEKIISHLNDKGLQVTHEYITEVKLNMKQHLSVVAMPSISINENATYVGFHVPKDEPMTSIDIKEEVTTEPDPLMVEECIKIEATLEENNSDQGNGAEKLLLNVHVEQTKPDDLKMLFICNNCHKIFYIKSKLIAHIKNSHYPPTGKQYSSSRNYTEATSMIEDITIHNEKKKLANHVCDKTFSTKSHLNRLIRTRTSVKPFTCIVCDKQFHTKQNLVQHMITHTDEKPFFCNVCEKQFKRKHILVRHMRTHTGEKPFACNVFEKQYSFKQNLHRHLRTHTGEKPFICVVCDKQFNTKPHLVQHMRTHTGEKPFACNVCEKQFNSKHILVQHMRIHTSQKPFICIVCDTQFNTKQHLVQHMRTHTGE